MGTLWFVEEILDFAQEHAEEIRNITDAADRQSVVGQQLATRADFERSREEVTILMGAVQEERHPGTGEVILLRRDVSTPTPMYEYGAFVPTETAVAPQAYYVLPEAADAIERLRAHGVTVVPVTEERRIVVERYQIDSTTVATREFQGHFERTIWGEWIPERVTLPIGTVAVPVDQALGRLAFSLLEPRSDDGFLAWAILDEQIESGVYPVLRVAAR